MRFRTAAIAATVAAVATTGVINGNPVSYTQLRAHETTE